MEEKLEKTITEIQYPFLSIEELHRKHLLQTSTQKQMSTAKRQTIALQNYLPGIHLHLGVIVSLSCHFPGLI